MAIMDPRTSWRLAGMQPAIPVFIVAASLLIITAAACTGPTEAPADLLIRNARVYTVDDDRPWAEAVAIRGEWIVWVGSDGEADRYHSARTRVIDAGGRLLLPGFVDSHNHIRFGSDPDVVKLHDAASLDEIRNRVKKFASEHPHLEWIEGEGWNYSAIPRDGLPDAADLEGLSGGRPAFLVSYDGHTAWLNREAMARVGITSETESVAFGLVEHDSLSGVPTGLLSNFATLGISSDGEKRLAEILPSQTQKRLYASLRGSLDDAIRFGITTIVDPQVDIDDLEMFERARQEEFLRSRLVLALFHPRGTSDEILERFEEASRRFDDDRLRVGPLKLYIDDVIEPHTAAMLEPYANRPGERGETLYPPAEFTDLIARLDRRGFQLFIHAIGDRGVRTALDALEHARAVNGPRDSRHQLVHIEVVTPEDADRFHELGVFACMQPRHAAPDITGQWAKNVGVARSRFAFAWKTLRDAGATLAFASDWDVAEMDPLIGIYTAVTRRGLDGEPPDGWIPGQRIDVATAVRAYTLGSARAIFADEDRGTIVAGKYADLILLSENLFEIPPERIKEARVVLTLVGGAEVYADPEFGSSFSDEVPPSAP